MAGLIAKDQIERLRSLSPALPAGNNEATPLLVDVGRDKQRQQTAPERVEFSTRGVTSSSGSTYLETGFSIFAPLWENAYQKLQEEDPKTDREYQRLHVAARLIKLAVEPRGIEAFSINSQEDIFHASDGIFDLKPEIKLLRGSPYRAALLSIIVLHLFLPLWGCDVNPVLSFVRWSCVGVYCLHIALLVYAFGLSYFQKKKWEALFVALTIVQLFALIWAVLPTSVSGTEDRCTVILISDCVRPYLLISQLRPLRWVFTNVVVTVVNTWKILSIGFVFMLFYSVVGVSLFNSDQVTGYDPRNDNFQDVKSALLSLYVLTTGENFPDVAEPAFSMRPKVSFPYFISFVVTFMVIVMPLMLATVLSSYETVHKEQLKSRHARTRPALLAAYWALKDSSDPSTGLTKDQFFKVTKLVSPSRDASEVEDTWRLLVKSGDVMQATSFLKLKGFFAKKEKKKKRKTLETYQSMRSFETTGCFQRLPGRFRQRVSNGYHHLRAYSIWVTAAGWFPTFVRVNAVLLAIAAVLWSPFLQSHLVECDEYDDKDHLTVRDALKFDCDPAFAYYIVEGVFILLFALEVTLRMVAEGWEAPGLLFGGSRWRRFEVGLALVSVLCHFVPNGSLRENSDFSDFVELPRAFRIIRLISVHNDLRSIFDRMHSIGVMLLDLLLLFCCVSSSFAFIGMLIFSDYADIPLDGLPERYNFGSYSGAMSCMMFLTIRNNWNSMLYPLIDARGRASCIFFFAYMLFCSTIMLDTIVGVVIEGYRVATLQADKQREETLRSHELEINNGGISPGWNGTVWTDDAGKPHLNSGIDYGSTVAEIYHRSPSLPPPGSDLSASNLSLSSFQDTSASRLDYPFARRKKSKAVRQEDLFSIDADSELNDKEVEKLRAAMIPLEHMLVDWAVSSDGMNPASIPEDSA